MAVAHRNRRKSFYYSLFFILLLAYGPVAGLAHSQVQGQNPLDGKNILVLHAFESNVPIFELTDRGIREALDSGGMSIRNQFFEYLDLARNPGPEYRERLVDLMRLRYGHRKLDIVITLYREALEFAINEGRDIFPEVPIVALYLPLNFEQPDTGSRILRQIVTPAIKRTLEIALQLIPDARRVYVVSGANPMEKSLEDRARKEFKELDGRLEFLYLGEQPMDEILATVSMAPNNSIVLLLGVTADVTGKTFTTREVGRLLSQLSKAPVFGLLDVSLGYGIVGGSLISFEYVGTRAAELALDILKGIQNPENIPDAMEIPHLAMFDWRQLRRWNLSERALPEGSIVINKELTLWDFRYYIAGALVFSLMETALIIFLIVQRRRKKMTEEALRQKNEELDQFFNISLDLMCIANTDGYFLRLNPAWERIFGYSKEELMTRRFVDFVHPDDRDATLEAVSALASHRDIVHFENRYRCKDGTYRWLDWASAPAGEFIYSTARDVTDRKQAEESLKERLRFETLLTEISAEFINLQAEQIDRAIQDAQARICQSLDLERSTLWQACDSDPRTLVLTHIHQPAGSKRPPEWMRGQEFFPWMTQKLLAGEVLAISKMSDLPPEADCDRESFHLYSGKSTLCVPLSVGEGPVFGVVAFDAMSKERTWPETAVMGFKLIAQVFASAIARKRADCELRENEARLSLATDAAGAGLWIIHLDTDEVWASTKTRELFHFAPDEKVTYKSFFKAIHPDDHDRVRQTVQKTLQSGEKLKCDHRIVLPDGSIRWLVAHGQRYPATKPVRLMGVSLDITERLNAEAEARQQWEQLAHVTRIGLMGELTASLAHEINQPLTAIQSNADAAQRFLSRPEPDTDEVRQILEDIIRDDTRASDIIRKIRALLKREPVPPAVLDLNHLIQDVLSLLRADSLLRELVIDAEFFPGLPPALGDRTQLQQVIINLILNGTAAMKSTPSARRKLIIKTAIQDDGAVKVCVIDSGTGIDESAIERLFEPFYTTKSEGLGMGLAISRTIIRAHGGTLEASNNPEGGATFALTLPAYQGDPA
ncbi:MAG: hypothetical protein QG552_2214 [Thermodesulfobacteriota bacterium]|nr:hypothetical protein [Thermodesulfobacteriota bacterium]